MNMTIIAHARKYAAAATKFFERERELTFVSSSFEAHLIIHKQQHLIICRQQHVCHKQSVTDTGKQRHQVFRERESCRNEFLIERSLSAQPVLLICCTVLIPLLCCWYVVRCMTPLSFICFLLYHYCVVDTLFIVWLLRYGYGACSRYGSCTLHCSVCIQCIAVYTVYSAYQKITSAACVVDMWYSIWLLCPWYSVQ